MKGETPSVDNSRGAGRTSDPEHEKKSLLTSGFVVKSRWIRKHRFLADSSSIAFAPSASQCPPPPPPYLNYGSRVPPVSHLALVAVVARPNRVANPRCHILAPWVAELRMDGHHLPLRSAFTFDNTGLVDNACVGTRNGARAWLAAGGATRPSLWGCESKDVARVRAFIAQHRCCTVADKNAQLNTQQ